MRTFVLILMIALLPLRMWAAGDMGVRMAQAEVAALQVSASDPMPEDCPMMASATQHTGSHDDSHAIVHCMSCQLCVAGACNPELAFERDAAPTGPAATRANHYVSADLAPDLRPPIS